MKLVTCPHCGGTGEVHGADCPTCYFGYVPALYAEHLSIEGDHRHGRCEMCGAKATLVRSAAFEEWYCVRCFASLFAPDFAGEVHAAREAANVAQLQRIAADESNPPMVREWAMRQLDNVPVVVVVPAEVPA